MPRRYLERRKNSRGYGRKTLDLLKKTYADCSIVLLIENTADTSAVNYEQRIRRLNFYEANGYKQLHININEAGVDYELLGTETTITCEEYMQALQNYFGTELFRVMYKGEMLYTDLT